MKTFYLILFTFSLGCASTNYEIVVHEETDLKLYVQNEEGVVLDGYDMVAYFTMGKPILGGKEFALEWDGVSWYFISSEHRELFKKSPEQYKPYYGGYCAYAVAYSKDVPPAIGNPKNWKIVDNRLYLNYNSFINFIWGLNIPRNIRNAELMWPQKKQYLVN